MLPLRQAVLLALLVVMVSAEVALHRAGYRTGPFCSALAQSAEKYGLYGYAVALYLQASRSYAAGAGASLRLNPGAAHAAADEAASNLVAAARRMAQQGHEAEAVPLLQGALRQAPWRRDVRSALLEAQIDQKDGLALRRLADLAYREDDPEAQYVLAKGYLRAGRVEDAGALLRHAAERAPNHFGLRLALANYLLNRGATSKALVHANRALELAQTVREKLQAADLVNAAGGVAPTAGDILWAHRLEQYGVTALVAAVYVLCLCAPAWLSALRALGKRVDAWAERVAGAG